MRIFALVYDGDLVDRDVGNLAALIAQIENAAFDIYDVTSKRGVCSARNIYLFAE